MEIHIDYFIFMIKELMNDQLLWNERKRAFCRGEILKSDKRNIRLEKIIKVC